MKYFIVILFLFLLCSCNDVRLKKDALSVVEQWIGKEIVYPENLNFTILGVDTLSNETYNQLSYRVVSYVDSTGCTSCKLQLPRWKAFIAEMDSVSKGRSVVYLILHSKEVSDIVYTLKYNNFKFPVYIDENNYFYKLNHLPSNAAFQTFLLDKNNKIMAIGNPIHNPKVKELYLKIIMGDKATPQKEVKIQTSVMCSNSIVDMGKFDWHQEQKATFTLTNTGNSPLVVTDVITSCGCTTVDYGKEPVRPGKSLELKVQYKADHPEHFDKTITVYCNTETSPIRLRITGNAE